MKRPEDKPAIPRRFRADITAKLCYRRNVPRVDPAGLPILDTRDGPPPWKKLVPGDKPVEIEVGPGKGRFLVTAGEGRPDTFFLGIEAAWAYACFTADRVHKGELANTLVIHDDARLFLEEAVPAGAVQAIHVYFPDPWPKRRHRKRRFFRPGVLEVLHRALAPDGTLYVATDNLTYWGETVALIGPSPLFNRVPELEGDGALPHPVAFGPTNFEIKYRAEGRTISRGVWRPTRLQ